MNAEVPLHWSSSSRRRVGPHRPTSNWSWPDFIDLRDAETGVSMTGWAVGRQRRHHSGVRSEDDGARRCSSRPTTSATIGVALARGPGFLKTDTTDPAVILGHAFWQQHLSSDPDIVGKTLTLDGTPHVVAGIAPETFRRPSLFS